MVYFKNFYDDKCYLQKTLNLKEGYLCTMYEHVNKITLLNMGFLFFLFIFFR